MKMHIDKWGEPYIHVVHETIEPYMVDASTAGTTYICYFNTPDRIIRKITDDNGITTIEFSWGAWDDRTTLTYIPINEAMEIEVPGYGA